MTGTLNDKMAALSALIDDLVSTEAGVAQRKDSAADAFRMNASAFAGLKKVGFSDKVIASLFKKAGFPETTPQKIRQYRFRFKDLIDSSETDAFVTAYWKQQSRLRMPVSPGAGRTLASPVANAGSGPAPSSRPATTPPGAPAGYPPATPSLASVPASPEASRGKSSLSWQPEDIACPVDELGRPPWDVFVSQIRKTKAQSTILSFNGKRGQFPLHKQVAVFRGKVSSWDEYELLD